MIGDRLKATAALTACAALAYIAVVLTNTPEGYIGLFELVTMLVGATACAAMLAVEAVRIIARIVRADARMERQQLEAIAMNNGQLTDI